MIPLIFCIPNFHKRENIAMCTVLQNFENKAVERGLQIGKINTFLSFYYDGTLNKEICDNKLNILIK